MRIAAVGDSLTAGDQLHHFLRAPGVKRCSIADSSCRGNYPLDLADLLGNRFEVRNFGRVNAPLCDGTMVHDCMEQNATNITTVTSHATRLLPLPLANATAACRAALQQSPLLGDALRFKPDVVVFMLGTNDAVCDSWNRCGEAGTSRAFKLLVQAILSVALPPLLLIVSPPPLLNEYNAGATKRDRCTHMHAVGANECVICGVSTERSHCFSLDAIRQVRALIRDGAHRLGAQGTVAAVDGSHSKCSGAPGELRYMPLKLPPISALYSGPVHLNAIGSALIACAVYEHLSRCGGQMCSPARPQEGAPTAPVGDAASVSDAALAANASRAHRYDRFCSPLQRAYRSTLSTRELLDIRSQLDASSRHGNISTFAFHGGAPAEPPRAR